MISKIKEFIPTFRNRLIYEFAARAQDGEKRKHIEFVGGNLVSPNPFYEFMEDGERKVFVDVEPIIQEFEGYTSLYSGDSDRLCGHYILSLAVGETLSRDEWAESIKGYMSDLGYEDTSKYVAVIHRDTDKEHAHIVSSRVRLVQDGRSSHFELVRDSNDRFKGMDSARKIESQFSLVTPKSDGWSKEVTENSNPDKDHAHIIRGISKEIFKSPNRPRTVSQLVDRFAEKGIQIRVRDKNGLVEGISYRLASKDGRWITGSTIMSTKLTWQALQRNGVSYIPSRDNAKLGLGLEVAQPGVASEKNDGMLFRGYVKIHQPNERLKKYFRLHRNCVGLHRDGPHLFMGFNVGVKYDFYKKTRNDVEVEIFVRRVAEVMEIAMDLVRSIIKLLFSNMPFDFDYSVTSGSETMSEYRETACRLILPAKIDDTGWPALDQGWQKTVKDQVCKQLSVLSKLSRDSERDAQMAYS